MRRMRFITCVVFVSVAAVLGTFRAHAQSGKGLSLAEVQAAVEWGKTGNPEPYILKRGPDEVAIVTTPFLRVALAVHHAQQSYQPLNPANLPEEITRATVDFSAFQYSASGWPSPGKMAMRSANPDRGQFVAPEQVLVLPKGSKDPAAAIRPIAQRTDVKTFLWMGSLLQRVAVIASFPMEVLNPDNEFVVIYAQPVWFKERELRLKALCGKWDGTMKKTCVAPDKKDPANIRNASSQ